MDDAARDRLIKTLQEQYKYYHGWHFNYEYPGVFVYSQMGGDVSVYFTPDHDAEGEISVQVASQDGEIFGSESIPYHGPLDAFQLFRIVKVYLDKHDGR